MQATGRAQKSSALKYAAAVLWIPALAYGAESITSRALTVDARFWWAHFFVTVLSLAGWAGSSLPKLAGWVDGMKEKLEILQGVVVALISGSIAYYGGFYLLANFGYNVPEIGCFIATIVAAWGGDRFLTPLLDTLADLTKRVTGRT